MEAPLRAYLVDDEPLAIERLARLLDCFDSLKIVGTTNDPAQALNFLNAPSPEPVDVLFLDIQMPGMTGFDLLTRLSVQPFVIFTTAYDDYALQAFEVNSIDYLVKPIDSAQLARAVAKLGRLRPLPKPDWQLDSAALLSNSPRPCATSNPFIRTASPPGSGSVSPSSTSTPSPTSSRRTNLPTPSSTAAATPSIKPSSNSSAASTPRASSAFIAPRWSTATGSTKSIPGSPARSSSHSKTPLAPRFPLPAIAFVSSNPASASDPILTFPLATPNRKCAILVAGLRCRRSA